MVFVDRSSDTSSCSNRLERVSDALNSIMSNPNSLQTNWTVVVLPTPGEPESSAALNARPSSV